MDRSHFGRCRVSGAFRTSVRLFRFSAKTGTQEPKLLANAHSPSTFPSSCDSRHVCNPVPCTLSDDCGVCICYMGYRWGHGVMGDAQINRSPTRQSYAVDTLKLRSLSHIDCSRLSLRIIKLSLHPAAARIIPSFLLPCIDRISARRQDGTHAIKPVFPTRLSNGRFQPHAAHPSPGNPCS